jgi:hypothetical protein
MTPLRQRMLDDMRLRHFSKHTVSAYLNVAEQFTRHFCALSIPRDNSMDCEGMA